MWTISAYRVLDHIQIAVVYYDAHAPVGDRFSAYTYGQVRAGEGQDEGSRDELALVAEEVLNMAYIRQE